MENEWADPSCAAPGPTNSIQTRLVSRLERVDPIENGQQPSPIREVEKQKLILSFHCQELQRCNTLYLWPLPSEVTLVTNVKRLC